MNENLDFDKLKDVVHYVCSKASDDPSCMGSVKLNKVLWYADSIAYLVRGKSITGEIYVKRQHGPVPKHILSVLDALIRDGRVVRGKVDHFGFMKNEYLAIKDPDLESLDGNEKKWIDGAFEHVCMNHTARSVSEQTHGIIWQAADMGERIPLYTVFASSVGELDEDDLAWAQGRLKIKSEALAAA